MHGVDAETAGQAVTNLEPPAPRRDPEPTGFDDFYRAEYRPLLRLAWAMTGRRDLGEDLVQEAMAKVHQRWEKVRRYDRPGAYARRILLNDGTSARRRRQTERRATERLGRPRLVVAPGPPPDEALWSAVRALPNRQAQVVTLHYVDDLSTAEIAQALGIAGSTVKVHLHRARLSLAETLSDLEDDR